MRSVLFILSLLLAATAVAQNHKPDHKSDEREEARARLRTAWRDRVQYATCIGAIPGMVYTASGPILAVSYNGVLLRANQPRPILSYTVRGNLIRLNFTTQIGDEIDAI